MTTTVRAVYLNGVLKPVFPLPLADGQEVEVTVNRVAVLPPPASLEEAVRRIREAKTWDEMMAASEAAAAFETLPPGYDLLDDLNQERIAAGQAPLFPPGERAAS